MSLSGNVTCFVTFMLLERGLVRLKLGIMGAAKNDGLSAGAAAVVDMWKNNPIAR